MHESFSTEVGPRSSEPFGILGNEPRGVPNGGNRQLHATWSGIQARFYPSDAYIGRQGLISGVSEGRGALHAPSLWILRCDRGGPLEASQACSLTVRCSIRFSELVCTTRSTKIPAVWIWSGSRAPRGTISSTSATVIRPHIATSGLKFRAVRR